MSSLAFLYYAATGIDNISDHYVGYFYWSAPVIVLLVVVLGVVEALPSPLGATAALSAAAFALAARAGGRMIVLRFDYRSWPDVTGFLVQAERTGVRACVANPASALVVTSQFICTRSGIADGQVCWLTPVAPRGRAVIMRLRQAVVTAGSTDHG